MLSRTCLWRGQALACQTSGRRACRRGVGGRNLRSEAGAGSGTHDWRAAPSLRLLPLRKGRGEATGANGAIPSRTGFKCSSTVGVPEGGTPDQCTDTMCVGGSVPAGLVSLTAAPAHETAELRPSIGSCGLRRWSERRPLTPVGGMTCPAVGLKTMKATYLVRHLKGAKRL